MDRTRIGGRMPQTADGTGGSGSLPARVYLRGEARTMVPLFALQAKEAGHQKAADLETASHIGKKPPAQSNCLCVVS